jgi:8-oxo-dGTP pyrophosphatase MutT (NUDIX family)
MKKFWKLDIINRDNGNLLEAIIRETPEECNLEARNWDTDKVHYTYPVEIWI